MIEWANQAAVIMRGAAVTTRMNAQAAELHATELMAQAKAAQQAARMILKQASEAEKQAISAERRAEVTAQQWEAKKIQHAAKIAAKKLEKEEAEKKKRAEKLAAATPPPLVLAPSLPSLVTVDSVVMPAAIPIEIKKESKEAIVDSAPLASAPSSSPSSSSSSSMAPLGAPSTPSPMKMMNNVDQVYIDGSRMLYWSSSSRSLALRGQTGEAQTQFIRDLERYVTTFDNKLHQMTIIFNDPILAPEYAPGSLRVDRRIATSSTGNLCNISVVGATPSTGGVDGYFIRNAMSPFGMSQMASSVYVTSDPFLTTVLTSSGINVLSAEMWQTLAPPASATNVAVAAAAGDIALQRLLADEAAAEARAKAAKIVPSSLSTSLSVVV
jgi:hypothetical protein